MTSKYSAGLLERSAGFRGDEHCQVRDTIHAAGEGGGDNRARYGDLMRRLFMEVKGAQRDRSTVRG